MDQDSVKPLKELLDSVREIDGFPIGKDEDILALSDPPFYTACPNPYTNEFIEEYGTPYDSETDDYHREPFVEDVIEGKGSKIYRQHTYHTKVPHKAIMKYIEHYTNPEDIVFDGFSGSGMTGVASKLTGRKYMLSELSPYASYLSYNYSNLNSESYEKGMELLNKVEKRFSYLYTYEGKTFEHVIYSEKFICPYCGKNVLFWDAIVDTKTGIFRKEMKCCGGDLTQRELEKIRDSENKACLFPITHFPQVNLKPKHF